MDKFKAMQCFSRIVAEGSLTAAANSLDASLPAVVRSLAGLEKHLGVRLLHRTTRRMSLTEEGKRYLESCRQILAEVDNARARQTVQRSRSRQAGIQSSRPSGGGVHGRHGIR